MIELEKLSLKELRQLQKDVENAINSYQEREKRKALAEVEALLRERNLTPADLAELIGKRGKKNSAPARYVNPANPGQTWTGRGRRPAWVAAHLDAGGSLDDLKI